MGELVLPIPKSKRAKWFGRKPRTLKDGDVKAEVFDVYRIMGHSKVHMRVYAGYASLDMALQAKTELESKSGDTCYVVGKTFRRTKKSGTR